MKTTHSRQFVSLLAISLAALAVCGSAFGQFTTTTWNAGTTGDWATGTNWVGGSVPPAGTATDSTVQYSNVVFPGSATTAYTATVAAPFTINTINLTGVSGHATTLAVTSTLTTTGINQGGTMSGGIYGSTNSAITVANGGSIQGVGEVQMGGGSSITVNAGGLFNWGINESNRGLLLNGSTATVNGALAGKGWTGNQAITVEGGGGTSSMTIDGSAGGTVSTYSNGTVVGDSLTLGYNVGSGTVNVVNNGTLTIRNWTTGSPTTGITLGNVWNGSAHVFTNTATLNLSSGTVTNGNNTRLAISYLATESIGSGTAAVNVSGGTFNNGNNVTTIGSGRVGSLNVSGSGVFTGTGDIYVGGTNDTISSAPTGSATASGALAVSSGSLTAGNIKVGDGDFATPLGTGANAAWTSKGTFTLTGGTVTATSLSATNGANSVVTFSGGTLITGGTTIANGSTFTVGNGTLTAALKLSGGSHSFANGITLANHATLSGTGTITSGTLVVSNGGTISPGNSPGTLNTAAETWNGGGNYVWEINNTTGAQGTNWDFINGSGALDLSALSPSSKFNINLIGLTAGNVSGAVPNWNNAIDQTWKIATFSSIVGFSAANFNVDATGFTNNNSTAGGRLFGVSSVGNDLFVTYAVPEPATWALLAGSLTTVMVLRRRRK